LEVVEFNNPIVDMMDEVNNNEIEFIGFIEFDNKISEFIASGRVKDDINEYNGFSIFSPILYDIAVDSNGTKAKNGLPKRKILLSIPLEIKPLNNEGFKPFDTGVFLNSFSSLFIFSFIVFAKFFRFSFILVKSI
jgi:hypothetical protein